MRLRIEFGPYKEEVSWYYELDQFSKLLSYRGEKYEWVYFDVDKGGHFDYVLVFGKIPSFDPNYYVTCEAFEDVFRSGSYKCECGAAYTSFPQKHMFFCPKWSAYD